MFTGLIETTSEIISVSKNSDGSVIQLTCGFADEINIGDSIAINGVCLTVTNKQHNILSFDVSNETLNLTNLNSIKPAQTVNLERAMKSNGRFDGHIVSGHIDGTAKITKITSDGFSYKYNFSVTDEICKYIVKKGSVTIDGISLTVVDITQNNFSVEVIPHTQKNTNLCSLKTGDIVNIETDIIARYVEKFLYLDKNKSKISMEMLKDNGYF